MFARLRVVLHVLVDQQQVGQDHRAGAATNEPKLLSEYVSAQPRNRPPIKLPNGEAFGCR